MLHFKLRFPISISTLYSVLSKFPEIPQISGNSPLPPGHSYGEYVKQLDINLSTVRAITLEYQHQLRTKRQAPTPSDQQNTYQPGDLIL